MSAYSAGIQGVVILLMLSTCLWNISLQEETEEPGTRFLTGNLSANVTIHSDGFPNQKYEPREKTEYVYHVRNTESAGGQIYGRFLDIDLAPGQKIEVFPGPHQLSLYDVLYEHSGSSQPRMAQFKIRVSVILIRFTNPRRRDDGVGHVGWRLEISFYPDDHLISLPSCGVCQSLDPTGGMLEIRESNCRAHCTWNIKTGNHSHVFVRLHSGSLDGVEFLEARLSNNSRDGELVNLSNPRSGMLLSSEHGIYLRISAYSPSFSLRFTYYPFEQFTLNNTDGFSSDNFTCPKSGAWRNDFCCNVSSTEQWRIPMKYRCDGVTHCPTNDDDEYQPLCKSTYGGIEDGVAPCNFPFRYKRVSYNHCIVTKTRDKPWCKVRGGSWGYCFMSVHDYKSYFIKSPPSVTGQSCSATSSVHLRCPNGACEAGFPQRCSTLCSSREKCKDGFCVQRKHMCDGIDHCFDGSDEREDLCTGWTETPTGKECPLSIDKRCPDGRCVYSYPYNCKRKCSSANLWKCDDGYCVKRDNVCDQVRHCIDGSDEERGCLTTLSRPTRSTTMATTTPSTPTGQKCGAFYSSHRTCPDGECVYGYPESCTRTVCKSARSDILCDDGYCIKSKHYCDGVEHCMDGSDEELYCQRTRECSLSEFRCRSKSKKCVPQYYVCDKYDDCGDNSDEADCEHACSFDEFRCRNRKKCVPQSYVCDDYDDCGDNSDEEQGCVTQPSSDDDYDMGSGETIAIVLGIAAGVIFLIFCCVCKSTSRRNNNNTTTTNSAQPTATGPNVTDTVHGHVVYRPNTNYTDTSPENIQLTRLAADNNIHASSTSLPPPDYGQVSRVSTPVHSPRQGVQPSAPPGEGEEEMSPFLPPTAEPTDGLPPPPSYGEAISGSYNLYT